MESETKSMVSENIMENVPILDVGPTTKKRNSVEINDVSHKKQKISSVTTTSHFDDMHASFIELPGVTAADGLLNNVETIAAEDFDRSISNQSINEINSGVEIKHVFDNNSEVLNLLVDEGKKYIQDNFGKKEKVDLNAAEGIEGIVQEGDLVQSKGDDDPTLIKNENQDINLNQQLELMIPDGLSNSVIETFDKVNDLNNIKTERNTDVNHKDTDQTTESENINNELLNAKNVSDGTIVFDNTDSASDNVNNASVSDNINNVSASDNINNACDTINNASGNTNSSSNNKNIVPPMKTRRERCWYGQACYRCVQYFILTKNVGNIWFRN